MRAAPLALLLLMATAARAEPARVQARLALGPLFDQNPSREVGLGVGDPSGGVSTVASLDASLQESERHLTTAFADLGARWFSPKSSASQLASRLTLAHAVRVGDRIALVLSGSGRDLQTRNRDRESSTVDGTLSSELGPWDWFSARVYGGGRYFTYRGSEKRCSGAPCGALAGPIAGTALRAEVLPRHAVMASYQIERRFHDSGDASTVSVLGVDWSYRGNVLLGAGYQLVLAADDPLFRGDRHRFQGLAGAPVPGDLILSVEATYQLANDVLVTTEDDEKYSSLGAKLTRPLAEGVDLEGTLRWYHSFQSNAAYDRLIVVVGVAMALGDPP